MQSNNEKTSVGVVSRTCGHCKNLGVPTWNTHTVRGCPVLAKTQCFRCKKNGHTSGYCPEKKSQSEKDVHLSPSMKVEAPPANCWANIVKSSLTPEEKAAIDLEARKNEEARIMRLENERRKKHEAWLERKAKKDAYLKQKQEHEDKNFALFATHMQYEHGYNWFNRFEEPCDKPILRSFHERIEKLIEEDRIAEWEIEKAAEERWAKEQEAKKALKKEMKSTLSPEEYRKWKQDYEYDEIDTWCQNGSDNYCMGLKQDSRRMEAGKIWLKEQMQLGTITKDKDGNYKYYHL
jgi:hypothetical protein